MNERIKELAMTIPRIKDMYEVGPVQRAAIEEFAELLLEKFAYDLMNVHGASPEHIVYVAKHYGVEL